MNEHMPDDRLTNELVRLAVWLEELGGILGPSGGPGLTDQDQIAPLSTFLAGMAEAKVRTAE